MRRACTAAQRMLERVGGLTEDDLVLCLISGGGSAAIAAAGVRVEPRPEAEHQPRAARERRDHPRNELRAAAPVRHQAAAGSRPRATRHGSSPCSCRTCRGIGRPTLPRGPRWRTRTTCADALAILRRYTIDLPPPVLELLESGRGESVKPGDPTAGQPRRRCASSRHRKRHWKRRRPGWRAPRASHPASWATPSKARQRDVGKVLGAP